MNFDLRTHESLALLAGILGLVEQELARLIFDLDPSSILSGIFGSMVLGSVGLGLARSIPRRSNGGSTKEDHP